MTEPAGGKVVIVEDNGVFRGVLKDRLSLRFPEIEIYEAEDLKEGTRWMLEHRPRVIFLDIRLPDGSGLDLARRIRDELPGTRVFICTNHDLPEYRDAAARCGASHFFAKQRLDWEEMALLVGAALERKAGHA